MSTVLKNPAYFVLLALLGIGAYVTYTLNLWGPMLRMSNAASAQAIEIGKEKLREFLQDTETGRQAVAMGERKGYHLDVLDVDGKAKPSAGARKKEDDEDEI